MTGEAHCKNGAYGLWILPIIHGTDSRLIGRNITVRSINTLTEEILASL